MKDSNALKWEDPQDLIRILRQHGLADGDDPVLLTPLTGGVSSHILKVQTARGVFVVKRALPKLRVSANWEAPIERSEYEFAWLETIAPILSGCVPRVIAFDASEGWFAMEYFDPAVFPIWKEELASGRIDIDLAAKVGQALSRIHCATAGDSAIAARFTTDNIFRAIRLEPYLEATANRHPDIADNLLALSHRTLSTKRALVHGDVSPKNILAGPFGPIFIDAECAWYGDPAFDIAFCLNHLLLKCLWNRRFAGEYLLAFDTLADSYFDGADWEPRAELEARAGQLLPALFLARIDGKSPVDYVTAESDRQLVRQTAVPLIRDSPPSPYAARESWARQLRL